MKKFVSIAVLSSIASLCSLQADEVGAPTYKLDVVPRTNGSFYENRVEIGFETGQLFDVGFRGGERFQIAPQIVTVRWQLNDVANEGWRRGNTEFVFSGFFTPIISGVEDRYVGALWGPRYNFVQEGWNIVPYIGSRVGIGFTDSREDQEGRGQGQDFVFTFTVEVGAKYIIDDRSNVSLGLMYQHFSNAGLSEPERENIGLDVLGPVFSYNYSFW